MQIYTMYHLELLLSVHSREELNKCDLCEYSTTTSGALYRHKLIHSGEKPHTCDLCDYSTRTSGDMKRHRRKHTG